MVAWERERELKVTKFIHEKQQQSPSISLFLCVKLLTSSFSLLQPSQFRYSSLSWASWVFTVHCQFTHFCAILRCFCSKLSFGYGGNWGFFWWDYCDLGFLLLLILIEYLRNFVLISMLMCENWVPIDNYNLVVIYLLKFYLFFYCHGYCLIEEYLIGNWCLFCGAVFDIVCVWFPNECDGERSLLWCVGQGEMFFIEAFNFAN